MNKEIIYFILNICFVFFISYSLYFNTYQATNIVYDNKFISLILIFIVLIFNLYLQIKNFGLRLGFSEFIFLLLFLNIATPIPDTSLIVSAPLKIFYDIRMDKTQFVVSCLSVLSILYMYLVRPKMLYVTNSGKKCLEIFNKNAYMVLIFSFIGCTSFSGILDATVDYLKNKMFNKKRTGIYIGSLFISILLYVHEIHQKNLSLKLV